MTFQPVMTVGHYEIIGPLGAGGMGVVFEARDTRLDRIVAVKVLPPDFAEDADRRVRFEREARTISQLSHPNLCTLFDVGEHKGQPYLVMELIRGVTIQQRLTKEPFRVTEVLELGAQLADALAAAHTERIIHRDVKPANIFVDARGWARLGDFDVSVDAAARVSAERARATATNPEWPNPKSGRWLLARKIPKLSQLPSEKQPPGLVKGPGSIPRSCWAV